MTTTIESLLRESRRDRAREDVYAEIRAHQIRIGRIVGPQTWDEIKRRVESEVQRHRAGRQPSDPEMSFIGTLGGFQCVTAEYPRVTLNFDSKDDLLAVVEYNYGASYGSERTWVRNIEVKFDEKDNHYLMFDGKRFDSPRAICLTLLEPLTNRRFTPPEV